ncbi:MAG: DUF815 domain-containing protein, partial [Myxococcota bacterium]
MGRFATWIARLGRVLELAERVLAERVGEPLHPDAFDRHLAFRWDTAAGPGRLVPIVEPDLFDLDDLFGVDRVVARLVANSEQFVAGFPSNHVLLYGDRGTGKSSAVKGLLGRFGGRGLRGAALAVTLEPCAHLGRTPPCTDGILASGLSRVFVGTADP